MAADAAPAGPVIANQNMIRSAQLIEDLFKDPAIGAAVRARAKAKFNDITIPEDTIAPIANQFAARDKALADQLAKMEKKIEEREAREAEEATFKSLEAKVQASVAKFSLTDEGKAQMLDRMKVMGNYTDPDAAAAFVVHSAPPAPVSGPNWAPKKMDLFGSAQKDEKFALLHKDTDAFLDEELFEFQRDPDKYVRETLGRAP